MYFILPVYVTFSFYIQGNQFYVKNHKS